MLNVSIAVIIYTSISFISYILSIFLYQVRSCSDTSQLRENSILLLFLICFFTHNYLLFDSTQQLRTTRHPVYTHEEDKRKKHALCFVNYLQRTHERPFTWPRSLYLHGRNSSENTLVLVIKASASLPSALATNYLVSLTSMLHRRIVRTFLSLVVRDKNFPQNYAGNETTLGPVK